MPGAKKGKSVAPPRTPQPVTPKSTKSNQTGQVLRPKPPPVSTTRITRSMSHATSGAAAGAGTASAAPSPPPPPPLKLPMAKLQPIIPTYDGSTSAKTYLEEFLHACKASGWPEASFAQILSLHLRGTAKSFYLTWIKKKQAEAAAILAANPPGAPAPPLPAMDFAALGIALQVAFQSNTDPNHLEQKCKL